MSIELNSTVIYIQIIKMSLCFSNRMSKFSLYHVICVNLQVYVRMLKPFIH